jgi:hypothetical protein
VEFTGRIAKFELDLSQAMDRPGGRHQRTCWLVLGSVKVESQMARAGNEHFMCRRGAAHGDKTEKEELGQEINKVTDVPANPQQTKAPEPEIAALDEVGF